MKPIRAAAIHDLSGFGKSSLNTIIPILSNFKVQVCPVPTAILSTQTDGFSNYAFLDLTEFLKKYIDHWIELGIDFDCIYSGFLGSADQIEIVEWFISKFKRKNQLILVDPVMGDNGSLYSSIYDEMVIEMRKLVKIAHIITPNTTEVKLLLNYKEDVTIKNSKELLSELSSLGPEISIITNIQDDNDSKVGYVVSYDKRKNEFYKISFNRLPVNYPGTGDAFTSMIIGCLLKGMSLPFAMCKAAGFISYCMDLTINSGYPNREGLFIEGALDYISLSNNSFNYEIF